MDSSASAAGPVGEALGPVAEHAVDRGEGYPTAASRVFYLRGVCEVGWCPRYDSACVLTMYILWNRRSEEEMDEAESLDCV